jgi:hypothetical protein
VWPAKLSRYREADWLGAPLTDEELQTWGRQSEICPQLPSLEESPLTAEQLAGLARSRWLWARWEHADAAGLPEAADYFVEWLQGPPCGRAVGERGAAGDAVADGGE